MMNNNWYKNEEEEKLAEKLISMEKAALKKWFTGDSSGYRDLWSKNNFIFFYSQYLIQCLLSFC